MDIAVLAFGSFHTLRLHEVMPQCLISSVDPYAAVAAQTAVTAAGGIVAADVLAVGQCEAQIDGNAVANLVAAHAGSCVKLSVDGIHPAGAHGVVKLTKAVMVGAAIGGNAIAQNHLPQSLRHTGSVGHIAPVDTA